MDLGLFIIGGGGGVGGGVPGLRPFYNWRVSGLKPL